MDFKDCVYVYVCVPTGDVWGEDVDTLGTVASDPTRTRGKTAILSRCNVTVFSEAVRLTDANPHCRLHIVGVSILTHVNTHFHFLYFTLSPSSVVLQSCYLN